MAANERPHILLIRLSAMGDVIHALHALGALRAARPDAFLGFLVEDRMASLLEGHPDIDRLHVYRRREWQGDLLGHPGEVGAGVSAFLAELRAARYDVSVDLQGNLKGGVLSVLSGAPRRIGLAKGFGIEGNHLFSSERVTPSASPLHRVDRALALVGPLGVRGPGGRPRIAISMADRAAADGWLAGAGLSDGGYAVFHPGASSFGLHKRWPAERYGELAVILRRELGIVSVVSWGPGERDLAETAVSTSNGAALIGPEPGSLKALARLIERAALFVAGDTGALHLAAYLGIPTVGLYGPKDPAIYSPRGPRTAVVWLGHDCSPCPKRSCPDPVCMTSITPELAWSAVRDLLAEAPSPTSTGSEKGN